MTVAGDCQQSASPGIHPGRWRLGALSNSHEWSDLHSAHAPRFTGDVVWCRTEEDAVVGKAGRIERVAIEAPVADLTGAGLGGRLGCAGGEDQN